MSDDFQPAQKKNPIWDNWIVLGLLANVSYATSNLLIGSLSELGIPACFYFCSGSLVFSAAYFVYQKEWSKRNNPEDQWVEEATKVLLRTWDNKFDWYSVLVVIVGGAI